VADEAEEPCFVEGLGSTDGDVGAEGAAEGDDGCPTNGEAKDQGDERSGLSPRGDGVDGVGVGVTVVAAEGDGDKDDEPEDAERAAVLDVATAAASARDGENDDLRQDPREVEDSVKSQYVHVGTSRVGLRILWELRGDAFDDDAFGFEVCDAVVGAVAHVDRLFEKRDEGARALRKPAIGGLIPVDGEVVGGVAFRADDGRVQPALEGAGGEFADGVGAGTDSCYAEIHRWGQGSTGVVGWACGWVLRVGEVIRLDVRRELE
jgi:hypothetical protein